MKDYPESIMQDVAWSFKEPIPKSLKELIDEVYKYNQEIGFPLDDGFLEETVSLYKLVVEYKYARETSAGWENVEASVHVNAEQESLTNGEILLKIHTDSYRYLHDMDHSYFEGLEYSGKSTNDGVPIYKMFLGS